MRLDEGYHWINHPVQGVIIVLVKGGLIYQMATLASKQADDKAFNNMAHVKAVPHNFDYAEKCGWF